MINSAVILISLKFCITIYFWNGFANAILQEMGSCRRQNSVLCDPNEILNISEGLRLQSELNTWESVLSSLCPPCQVCNDNADVCDTRSRVYILTEPQISSYDFEMEEASVAIIGKCDGNISVVFESALTPSCSTLGLTELFSLTQPNKTWSEASSATDKDTPTSASVSAYISSVALWYYNALAIMNTRGMPTLKLAHSNSFCYVMSVSRRNTSSKPVDSLAMFNVSGSYVNKTSVMNINMSMNTNSDHLLTHHSHHGITNNILTIIACVLGSGAMGLLLCFRQVRHLLCSICSICRRSDDFRRLLVDPDD